MGGKHKHTYCHVLALIHLRRPDSIGSQAAVAAGVLLGYGLKEGWRGWIGKKRKCFNPIVLEQNSE